ncbi:MAG: lactonase family protein [Pseudomonadota bacterium]|nr:lactonase family protein [Pseudomonadota bacterium]
MWAYVGSRTTRERNARGEGISVYRVDAHTGALDLVQVLGGLVNPSFLAINRAATRLYAVHGDCEDISAFGIEPGTGRLALINRQPTGGRNPVHLALDPSERFVIVSNHLGSSLAVLPLDETGALQALSQLLPLSGTPGPHRLEQPFAKPHFNPFDPSGRWVLVPDKGVDRVFALRFAQGRLTLAHEAVAREGAGPRHLAFHPRQPWAYAINELDSTVTTYDFDAASGALQPLQIVSALSDRFTGNSRASEIAVHPGGQALYASNRGEDSVAVFRIDPADGHLRLAHTQPAGGRTPRFFTLSPCARWLYVLNEDSDGIVQLAVDDTGLALRETGRAWACGSPVCMVFAQPFAQA